MKKTFAVCLAAILVLTGIGCGGRQDAPGKNQEGAEPHYAEALEVLDAILEAYGEGELFAVYGGDQEHAVMDALGKFDVSKAEELKTTLGLPESQIANIEDAASMVHMMNANTFTGAAYRLKDGVDMGDFADSVKSGILATQWICGQPDTLIILCAGGDYVVTAYGEGEIIEAFKDKALSALDGSEMLVETPIG